MKLSDCFRTLPGLFVVAAILLSPIPATADWRADALGRCLQDFEGLVWKLPYRPPINVRSCSTPTANYDDGKSVDGQRSLEFIGELTLGPESSLPPDEQTAAIETAVFAHFDALFLRQGYRRGDVEYDNARTNFYLSYYLEHHISHDTPLPYVKLARYERSVAGRDITLTYKKALANTWKIVMEVHPAAQDRPTGTEK